MPCPYCLSNTTDYIIIIVTNKPSVGDGFLHVPFTKIAMQFLCGHGTPCPYVNVVIILTTNYGLYQLKIRATIFSKQIDFSSRFACRGTRPIGPQGLPCKMKTPNPYGRFGVFCSLKNEGYKYEPLRRFVLRRVEQLYSDGCGSVF